MNKLIQLGIYIEGKVFAIVMIVLSCVIIYYSNFFKTIFDSPEVNNTYLFISICLYFNCLCIICYLAFYLPRYNINEEDWPKYCPNMIPTCTISGIIGMIFLVVAVWDIYGVLAIPLIIVVKIGFLMTAHFAPNGVLGNLVFFGLLLLLIYSGHLINHDN